MFLCVFLNFFLTRGPPYPSKGNRPQRSKPSRMRSQFCDKYLSRTAHVPSPGQKLCHKIFKRVTTSTSTYVCKPIHIKLHINIYIYANINTYKYVAYICTASYIYTRTSIPYSCQLRPSQALKHQSIYKRRSVQGFRTSHCNALQPQRFWRGQRVIAATLWR